MKILKKFKKSFYKRVPFFRRVNQINTDLEVYGSVLSGIQNNILNMDAKVNRIESLLDKINCEREISNNFSNHYEEWRSKRIKCFVNHYGCDWFHGKRILELGCGYADIGNFFHMINADVTCCDARAEHINEVRKRYPYLNAIVHNSEDRLPDSIDKFDLVIHTGLLYHLDNYEGSIIDSLRVCDHMILETEVCDSEDENFEIKVEEKSESYDQSFSGIGSRPSIAKIEKILTENNVSFVRYEGGDCNSGFHRYDWDIENSGTWDHGLRAMWFIKKRYV